MDMSPFVKCTCPACFEEIYLGECAIVSGISTEFVTDDLGRTVEQNVVMKPMSRGPLARLKVDPLNGPKYTNEKAQRKCTECGYLLPNNIERVPSITLSIVGNTSSGKTHFIAAFIYELRMYWLSTNTFAQFQCLTPDVEEWYNKEIFEPLLNHGKPLPGTYIPKIPKPSEPRLRLEPLIYKLTLSSSPRRPATTINLMIYDSAGETYEDTTKLVQVGRFVFKTSALIFVADPYQFTSAYTTTPSGSPPTAALQSNTVADNITKIVDIFNLYHRESDGASLARIPVAIMISKTDLFNNMYPVNQYTFMKEPAYVADPHYNGTVNLKEVDIIDKEVQDLLLSYRQRNILAVTGRFKHRKFFATSTTGEPLDPIAGRFLHVNPRRCLDPILWILYTTSIIRGN